MAAKIGLSPAAFGKRFRNMFWKSVSAYLTQMRVQHARKPQTKTPRRLYEIADRVGDDREVAATETFKTITARTPTRYRREAK